MTIRWQRRIKMNCTNCGAPVGVGVKFCLSCGSPVQPPQAAPAPPGPYGPAPASAPMGEQSPILVIPAIFGIIGGIMMIVGDFGGWYNYNYYAGYEEWIYINSFGYAAVLILPMALLLFFSAAVSLKAFRSPLPVARKLVLRGLIAAIVVLIITVIGAVVLLAATMDASDNWLGVGFYGAFFGSLLTSIILGYESRRLGRALGPPAPPAYARAPAPAYGPQPQPPPYQPAPPPQPVPPPQPQPPTQPRCRNCGTFLQPGTRFCVACGAPQ